MKKTLSIFAYICLGPALCSLLFSACKKKEVEVPREKVINARAQSAEKRAVRPFINAIGTLNPYEEVVVSAEVDGILKEVHDDEGTVVSRGMALDVIDETEYRLQVQTAEAALKQAEANRANAKLEIQRMESLFREGLITKQQFDDVSTRLSIAEAEVEKGA
jgi:multidrug efflux pump subunit AcrA (membrane-fusion protein)